MLQEITRSQELGFSKTWTTATSDSSLPAWTAEAARPSLYVILETRVLNQQIENWRGHATTWLGDLKCGRLSDMTSEVLSSIFRLLDVRRRSKVDRVLRCPDCSLRVILYLTMEQARESLLPRGTGINKAVHCAADQWTWHTRTCTAYDTHMQRSARIRRLGDWTSVPKHALTVIFAPTPTQK